MSRPSSKAGRIARRSFLVAAGVIGGGLLVGAGAVAVRLHRIDAFRLPAGAGETSFGAWLKLGTDGRVEVAVPHQDMGQGIYALATLIVASELGLAPEKVRPIPAPINARFANPVMLMDGLPLEGDGVLTRAASWTFEKILRAVGVQATGGSTSTRNIAEPLRAAAAAMRDMLARAAAARFAAPVERIRFVDGVALAPDGKRATFAELADAAAKLPPREIPLGPLAPDGLIGKGAPRGDVPAKARGQAAYAIDVREKGQLYAAIRHAPRLGARLKSARSPVATPGVRGLVEGADYVAVVAESTAVALAEIDNLQLAWDEKPALAISTRDVFAAYRAALDQGAGYRGRWVVESRGDLRNAAGAQVAATYSAPFLAHVTMEPINATALVTDIGAKVWAGTQSPQLAQMIAARAAGVDADSVEIVTPFLGGGFGRRVDVGFVGKAVEIAKKFKGVPVQTIWSRAQDMRDDVYRPAALADLSATLDANGLPATLAYRVAAPSIVDQFVARLMPRATGGLMADRTALDGALRSFYGVPNVSLEHFAVDAVVPVGFWRSVGFSLNCFFLESFVDELAHAAKAKPLDYRTRLLAVSDNTRAARRAWRVLELMARFDAAEPLAPPREGGRVGRGFALTEPFHSFVGMVADVEVVGADIRVRRVHAVVDCGLAIDPPNVIAQVRGGINFGLSAALFGEIEFENGAIRQRNFDSYPLVTLANAPRISVDIASSGADIGGVGEIGAPAIAPAVANAIFAATGERLRSMPFRPKSA